MIEAAPDNSYFEWLVDRTGDTRIAESPEESFMSLLEIMHQTPFKVTIANDINRALDGIELRKVFTRENPDVSYVWLNEQEAREIMLLPFEYALSSKEGMGNAHAVMSAMNRIGTDWVGANTHVLVDIMRGEWDFDGYCITDMAASDTA